MAIRDSDRTGGSIHTPMDNMRDQEDGLAALDNGPETRLRLEQQKIALEVEDAKTPGETALKDQAERIAAQIARIDEQVSKGNTVEEDGPEGQGLSFGGLRNRFATAFAGMMAWGRNLLTSKGADPEHLLAQYGALGGKTLPEMYADAVLHNERVGRGDDNPMLREPAQVVALEDGTELASQLNPETSQGPSRSTARTV